MPLTDAQKRAQENYRKKSVKQVAVRFYPADADIWEWLQSRENRQGYIRDLIRADMERGRAGNHDPRWPGMTRDEPPRGAFGAV